MSGTNVSTNSVGPTAEIKASMRYGDAVYRKFNSLQPQQFGNQKVSAKPMTVISPSEDNGWIGPLGITSMHSSAGSLYGYGVPTDNPQY